MEKNFKQNKNKKIFFTLTFISLIFVLMFTNINLVTSTYEGTTYGQNGCWVWEYSASADTNKPSSADGEITVGYSSGSKYGYWNFTFDSISPSVTYDHVFIYLKIQSKATNVALPFWIYPINSAWDYTTITYNNQPTVNTTVLAQNYIGAEAYLNPTYYIFDVTTYVNKVMHGQSFNGFRFYGYSDSFDQVFVNLTDSYMLFQGATQEFTNPHFYFNEGGIITSNTSTYTTDTNFTLTMIANEGFIFSNITRTQFIDGTAYVTTSTDNPYTVTNLISNEIFYAYFTDLSTGFINPRFYVTGMGAVTTNTTDRYLGMPLELTFIPNDGWSFSYLTRMFNGSTHYTNNPIVISQLRSNDVFGVIFTEDNPTASATVTPQITAITGVLDFFFGSDGTVVNAGFGLLIFFGCCLIGFFLAGKSFWGFFAGMNIGFIVNLVSNLWDTWVLVPMILIDIAILLKGTNILKGE